MFKDGNNIVALLEEKVRYETLKGFINLGGPIIGVSFFISIQFY